VRTLARLPPVGETASSALCRLFIAEIHSAAKPQPKAGRTNRGIRGKQTSSRFAFRVFSVFRGSSLSRRFVAACEQLPLLQCRGTQRRKKEKALLLCVSPRPLRLCVNSSQPVSKSGKPGIAFSRALPGRSTAAARLRSWRWGKTARKPAKLACCRPPPALAGWGRNE
jgi:hypothetical protein